MQAHDFTGDPRVRELTGEAQREVPIDQGQSAEALWRLINAHTLAHCVHVVAEFGVADY